MPIIRRMGVHKSAGALLKSVYGENAEFREGQYEAIESIFIRKRVLVVQKTGWGKSLIYFIATKINRKRNAGVTFVISPLIVVMQNQLESAKKFGLKCDALNCETKSRRLNILNGIKNEQYDIIFITPETLFSKDVETAFNNNEIRIGLFVIDEVHCISDWGHDFRLEYGKLHKVVKNLPPSVPILGTTATANDRVLADIEKQLGKGVHIFRGSLFRESLAIQVMKMPDKSERYAWILKNINKLPGSGVIYCITIMDCEELSAFLVKHGVKSESYHSARGGYANNRAERKFRANEIKVLVATIKLGMGYDKNDIGFIIHFQAAPNIVSYYQQIGRAGRNLPEAHIFLMAGYEDVDIQDYFIDTAFPYEYEVKNVLKVIRENPECSIKSVKAKLNMRESRVDKAMEFLIYEGFVCVNNKKYLWTKKTFTYKRNHYDEIKRIRKKEGEEMHGLVETKECYSKYIINCLDDMSDIKCGKCTNCLGQDIVDRKLSAEEIKAVALYINSKVMYINPRTYWANAKSAEDERIKYPNKIGICLSKWGDAGYGEIIKNCKKEHTAYPGKILNRAVEILDRIVKRKNVALITFVPSKKNSLIEDFAKRLAERLGIACEKCLAKVGGDRQKGMQNSFYQCRNALVSYQIIANIPKETVILIDDLVDSGWTLAACGYKLRERGAKAVIPFVLADSSMREED